MFDRSVPIIPIAADAKRTGNGFIQRCPAHEDRTPSLSQWVDGNGRWAIHCHAGCSFEDIIAAAQIGDAFQSRYYAPIIDKPVNTEYLADIWSETFPITSSDAAQAYMSRRGLLMVDYADIRAHRWLWFADRTYSSAIVSKIRIDGVLSGIHRTFIKADGQKKERRILGKVKNGCVHISNANDRDLVISEGIENGIAHAQINMALTTHSYRAALNANNLPRQILPKVPGKLTILPDIDGSGIGQRRANELAEKASRMGWRVFIDHPDQGSDWNDHLLEERNGYGAL